MTQPGREVPYEIITLQIVALSSVMFVLSLVILTMAHEMAPPLLPETAPLMEPVSVCA
jgi:hypothetical protein